jgi:hypothetical protein
MSLARDDGNVNGDGWEGWPEGYVEALDGVRWTTVEPTAPSLEDQAWNDEQTRSEDDLSPGLAMSLGWPRNALEADARMMGRAPIPNGGANPFAGLLPLDVAERIANGRNHAGLD